MPIASLRGEVFISRASNCSLPLDRVVSGTARERSPLGVLTEARSHSDVAITYYGPSTE